MASRKVGYTESIFSYLHDFARGVNNTVARVEVTGTFEKKQLWKAFEALFNRHPFLHSVLVQEGDDVWIKPKARFEDIPIVFGQLERTVEEEATEIIDTLYDPAKFLWKVAIYPQEKTTLFLFGFHHSIADGLSLLSFTHQLIEVYEKMDRNPFLKLDPMPVLDNIEKLLGCNQTIEQFNQQHEALFTPEVEHLPFKKWLPIDERRDQILLYSLNEKELEQLVQFAKQKGTTINSLLFTAMCFACARQEGRKIKMRTISPANLRKCVNPHVGDDHLGIFITPIHTDHTVDPKSVDYIAFAKEYREELFKRIETLGRKPEDIDHLSTHDVYNEFVEFNQQEIDYFPYAVALTNLGRSPFPKHYVDHKMENFFFATNRLIGDIKYTLHVATVNDQLHIAQVHTSPLATDEEAEEFKKLFLQILLSDMR